MGEAMGMPWSDSTFRTTSRATSSGSLRSTGAPP
eukprot:CAMPEP_0194268802 /NCGR_PEP_ID=MMETSP0169-20130528/3069_1 /TAXON_ID=218684 /ORGANISM="Corethron pennatum, Strain L29A3" /LENGTH=33 /DNA_ID= /DNA_START= /DNA_END= /DNA_ORIENTATION=